MGVFDTHGGTSSSSSTTAAPRRGVSPARSPRNGKPNGGGSSVRPRATTPHSRPQRARSASGSLFGIFGATGSHRNDGGRSRSVFGSGAGGSSYYKRRPRDGYFRSLMHTLQRMLREWWSSARRHPIKAFFAIVVPVLSAGGAIGGLLRRLGIRMPMGMGESSCSSGSYAGRGRGGGYYGSRGYDDASGSWMEGGGWMGQAGSVLSVAKMFM